MCGVAGILAFQPQNLPEPPEILLDRMLSRLEHRGPDGQRSVVLKDTADLWVGFGHSRLSIIDLSDAGRQPMSDSESSVWISSNNEIYNYKELRRELESSVTFRSDSDTEVLLHTIKDDLANGLNRLRGMFAFGYWDSARETLSLARDRLGVKPLYYYQDENCLIFASEIRSILATGIPAKTLKPQSVFQFLSFGRPLAPDTLIEGIKELRPGHLAIWNSGDFHEESWWNPASFSIKQQADIEKSAKEHLQSAVNSRLVSDVPVGVFLSGGMDSCAVASLCPPPRPRSLSMSFSESAYDESVYARETAEFLNLDHQKINISPDEALQSLPDFIAAMDQPTLDGLNVFLISRQARANGWKVALSGLGGDELFGGYPSFQLLPKLARYQNLLNCLPRSFVKGMSALLRKFSRNDRDTKLLRWMSGDHSGPHPWFLLRSLFSGSELNQLWENEGDLEAETELHWRRAQLLVDSVADWDLLNQVSFLEATQYMVPTLLKDADVMGMSQGLEIRVPWVDHLLVEWMFSLSANEKFKIQGPLKPLMYKALQGNWPEGMDKRRKAGFTLPFEVWMRGELREEMERILFTHVPILDPYLQDKGVRRVWDQFLKGRTAWSRPWAIYVLKKWVLRNI
ncbi:MAG: asparagine synthase (glutamine-hydrolyzing) [Candidatus Nitrohelix vancouverensis]|uniref:asparagine synthase (glutamine-hydrolyzing) n=1 Tax=Candidatus Nitrohelix vancouverensis TaxID=2705534 RepID=A0A7T0C3N1_9BACT|nr:MAG: asparagine synthase (glutamine-hydrolyzing) [Candidatus Nitrohelix vancouverensis]